MASLCLSASVSLTLRPQSSSYSSSPPSTSACPSCSSPASNQLGFRKSPLSPPPLRLRTLRFGGSGSRRRGQVVRMAPDEERMTRRSPLDFPIEWERPKPGRRPDIFPQFSPMKTPLPPPMPADPPEEDEEEEEEKKEEEEEEPEKEEEKPEGPEGS